MTFPITFSGLLTTVTLPIFCSSGDLVLSIQVLDGSGEPSGTNLASQQFASGAGVPTSNQSAVDFVFDTPAVVTSGSNVAVVAQSLGSCGWLVSSTNSYADGNGFFSSSGSSWGGTVDFPFGATIMPTSIDNCPSVSNPLQADLDADGVGDACDYEADGDINGDSVVDVADILLGQKILLGIVAPTSAQTQRGDVAPLVGGVPTPDGIFEAGDLLIIQQKVNQAISF